MPINERVVIKSGDTTELSVASIKLDIALAEKKRREIVGQIGIQKATLVNITRTHPHIAKMSEEDLTAAYLYREATGYLSIGEPSLIALDADVSQYKQELLDIEAQTGIKEEIPENTKVVDVPDAPKATEVTPE